MFSGKPTAEIIIASSKLRACPVALKNPGWFEKFIRVARSSEQIVSIQLKFLSFAPETVGCEICFSFLEMRGGGVFFGFCKQSLPLMGFGLGFFLHLQVFPSLKHLHGGEEYKKSSAIQKTVIITTHFRCLVLCCKFLFLPVSNWKLGEGA